MTTIRFSIPTCGAASPTPFAAYIVSNISSAKIRILGLMLFISLHFFLRHSSPIVLKFLIPIVSSNYFIDRSQTESEACRLENFDDNVVRSYLLLRSIQFPLTISDTVLSDTYL